jgi:excisionase family DNA binding protein
MTMRSIVCLPVRRRLWQAAGVCTVLLMTADWVSAQTVQRCESAVLTLAEAATLLRVSPAEIERFAGQGGLPARRIGSAWRFSCDALMEWLGAKGDPPGKARPDQQPLDPRELATVAGAGVARGRVDTPQPPQGQPAPIGEKPSERDAEDVFLRAQRVLLRRGEIVVDFGEFYSRSDDRLLAAVAGGVTLGYVEQKTFTTLLMGRVGIFDETELFAGTAFHSQDIRQFVGNTTLASSGRSDLGGTQLGVRRTLLREKPGRPDIVLTVAGQLPTGDASYGAGGGLILVKSVDPVVLFANANYFRSFGDDAPTASVTPKSIVDVSVGYGLALNDTLAISMAVSGLFSGKVRLDETRDRPAERFSARFGLTSWLAKGLYIEPSVSFGLNGPGRSFAFGVSLPYTF